MNEELTVVSTGRGGFPRVRGGGKQLLKVDGLGSHESVMLVDLNPAGVLEQMKDFIRTSTNLTLI